MTLAHAGTACPDCGTRGQMVESPWYCGEKTPEGWGFYCDDCGFQIAASARETAHRMLRTLIEAADRPQAREVSAAPDAIALRDELRRLVECLERLDAEKTAIAERQDSVLASVKGRWDTTALRRILAFRKRDPQVAAEQDAAFEIYMAALEDAAMPPPRRRPRPAAAPDTRDSA